MKRQITHSFGRITRGFSRLGIAAAVLASIGGGGITAFVSADAYSRQAQGTKTAPSSRGLSDADVGLVAQFDPANPYEYQANGRWWRHDPATGGNTSIAGPITFDDLIPSPAAVATKTAGIGLGITGLLALAAWGFLRGLGRVVAGFARD
jgi:hypothetical protein